MGRPSNREARRLEILQAFSRVLADHGYAGATIAAVAREAGVSPGLLHHHFHNKDEMLSALLEQLLKGFRRRAAGSDLASYVDGALKLDERADVGAARCWVSVFAEALRNPTLFARVRRLMSTEIAAIQSRSGFSEGDAAAVLSFIVGALVLGSFAPRKTDGFAAPALHRITAMMS